ncbi:hypothetical protein ACWJJH_22195 [Endozoicomonadaceae bacterium StTr2]
MMNKRCVFLLVVFFYLSEASAQLYDVSLVSAEVTLQKIKTWPDKSAQCYGTANIQTYYLNDEQIRLVIEKSFGLQRAGKDVIPVYESFDFQLRHSTSAYGYQMEALYRSKATQALSAAETIPYLPLQVLFFHSLIGIECFLSAIWKDCPDRVGFRVGCIDERYHVSHYRKKSLKVPVQKKDNGRVTEAAVVYRFFNSSENDVVAELAICSKGLHLNKLLHFQQLIPGGKRLWYTLHHTEWTGPPLRVGQYPSELADNYVHMTGGVHVPKAGN